LWEESGANDAKEPLPDDYHLLEQRGAYYDYIQAYSDTYQFGSFGGFTELGNTVHIHFNRIGGGERKRGNAGAGGDSVKTGFRDRSFPAGRLAGTGKPAGCPYYGLCNAAGRFDYRDRTYRRG
jgi:hypothetical protein